MIWYFRGHKKAKKTLEQLDEFAISAVVYMELLQGIRNKTELQMLKKFMIQRNIHNISLNAEVTSRAIFFLEKFNLSHGMQMADALIAATADLQGETLLTGNYVHYKMIPGLLVKRFHP